MQGLYEIKYFADQNTMSLSSARRTSSLFLVEHTGFIKLIRIMVHELATPYSFITQISSRKSYDLLKTQRRPLRLPTTLFGHFSSGNVISRNSWVTISNANITLRFTPGRKGAVDVVIQITDPSPRVCLQGVDASVEKIVRISNKLHYFCNHWWGDRSQIHKTGVFLSINSLDSLVVGLHKKTRSLSTCGEIQTKPLEDPRSWTQIPMYGTVSSNISRHSCRPV